MNSLFYISSYTNWNYTSIELLGDERSIVMFQVLYPALPSHPQHEVHKKQTKGMSGMISFYLKGELEQSSAFLSALKVFTLAESLGGYESLAELPSIMTHASVPPEVRQFPLVFFSLK